MKMTTALLTLVLAGASVDSAAARQPEVVLPAEPPAATAVELPAYELPRPVLELEALSPDRSWPANLSVNPYVLPNAAWPVPCWAPWGDPVLPGTHGW